MPEDNDVDISQVVFNYKEGKVKHETRTIICPNCETDLPINGKGAGKCPKCGWVESG